MELMLAFLADGLRQKEEEAIVECLLVQFGEADNQVW
jgi:hypothetical protein